MKACRICKGDHLEQFLSLGKQPHCNSFLTAEQLDEPEPCWPLDVYYCHDCHLVQLGHVVDPDRMFRHFLYVSGTTRTLCEHFQRSADDLVSRFGIRTGSLVVDIGSNDGTWLKCFKSHGMNVVGVDPARNLARLANRDGIYTIADYFGLPQAQRIRAEKGAASVITAAGVFFHIDDMDDVCRGIHHLLADDGVLHVQAIYLGQVLEQNSFDNFYHEHLSLYTLKPLMRLFDRFDMEVFDVSLSSIHGGSLMLYVAKKGAYPVRASVDHMVSREQAKGWYHFQTYSDFAQRVSGIRQQLCRMIEQFKAQGARIAAYAAPAKGNTLLNYCNLNTDKIDFAVERAPLKIGLYTPGAHLPVISEEAARLNPPDVYLLLAWNFKQELIRKNRKFLASGGQFIVPIPEPHLVTEHDSLL